MAQRIKTVQESDLRMLGSLARSIQRVLPVTQADIDAAAALGKGWVVTRVLEVSEPLDNLRGGTQLVIRQNSILPGQNVQRVLIVSGPGGQTVVIRGTSPLSLPDAIADSLSYVKAFGGTEQRNLPSGFTELQYIESTGTQYIDPDVSGDARWVITAQANAVKGSSQSLISSSPSARGGTWYGEFTSTGYWDIVSGGTNIPPTTKTTADLTFDGNGARGTIGSTSVDRVASVTQGTWRIFATTGGGSAYPFAGKLFDAKVYQNGTLVRDFVPAKNSSGVVGMYDLVSGQFFTNSGTGDFVAGPEVVPTPDRPIDIVSNNGVLKVNSQGQIYTDGTVETIKDSLNNTATAEMLLKVGDYQDEQEILSGAITRKCGVYVFDGSETFIDGQNGWITEAAITDQIRSNAYVPFCTHFLGTNDTPQANSNTIRVYRTSSNIARVYFGIDKSRWATTTAFQQWVAEQYAAGTPIIVVYALATATTETVTGQTLQVQAGDNTLEITQASLSGLELEAEYEKESA